MEYITKRCPSCNGELHIPADMTTCICMYCGETFHIEKEEQTKASEDTMKTIEAEYQKTLTDTELLIKEYDYLLHQFTADRYAPSFEQYAQTGRDILQPAERYAAISDENVSKVLEDIPKALLNVIDQEINKPKKVWDNIDKARYIDQLRFFLAVFTVPMILHLGYRISGPLADAIILAWGQKYPKYKFEKSDYERILEGFKRKGFCFITTAVCETLHKEDDCYELTAFRHFRDSYMLETEERRALVEEYYRIAPVIVTSINLDSDSELTYQNIWARYLMPCLKAIEEDKSEDCERYYSLMVNTLKSKYYHIA